MQVDILRMFQQFSMFEQYKERLSGLVGEDEACRIVNGALVLITLGGNDFVNNYFLVPFSARSRQFTVPQFCTYLVSNYKNILTVIILSYSKLITSVLFSHLNFTLSFVCGDDSRTGGLSGIWACFLSSFLDLCSFFFLLFGDLEFVALGLV
jgi:hypothetical protein